VSRESFCPLVRKLAGVRNRSFRCTNRYSVAVGYVKTLLIAVAGGSGSGKTWLTARLARRLGSDCERLCLDDFYRDRSHLAPGQRARINFDHPRAVNWPCLHNVLLKLAAGFPACIPSYDFSIHCRRSAARELQPKPVLLLEGLWPWHTSRIRHLLAFRVFVECPFALRLERRMKRDISERGRAKEEVLQRFEMHVQPMHRRFVEPLRKTAHLVLRSPIRPAALAELDRRIRQLLDSRQTIAEVVSAMQQACAANKA
jgi:uridine kinase